MTESSDPPGETINSSVLVETSPHHRRTTLRTTPRTTSPDAARSTAGALVSWRRVSSRRTPSGRARSQVHLVRRSLKRCVLLPPRTAPSKTVRPNQGTAYGDAAGQRWCRGARCPYGPSGGASGDGASNGDAICLTSFVVRHQRLRQRGVHVRGPRVRWIEHAERPFPARPRWPSQVILPR